MDTPVVNYRKIERYSKQFEPIFGDYIKEGFFKIQANEIKGAGYGDTDEVPEGVCVKLAVPGTSKTKNAVYITYEEGDLEICEADDSEVYGVTIQKIVPVGSNFPYLRKQFQTAVFRGEYVGIATGHFVGILMDMTGIGTTVPAVKDFLYVGTKGILSLAGENGVGGSPSGKKIAQVIGLDRLPIDRTDGSVLSGSTHQELTVKLNLVQMV